MLLRLNFLTEDSELVNLVICNRIQHSDMTSSMVATWKFCMHACRAQRVLIRHARLRKRRCRSQTSPTAHKVGNDLALHDKWIARHLKTMSSGHKNEVSESKNVRCLSPDSNERVSESTDAAETASGLHTLQCLITGSNRTVRQVAVDGVAFRITLLQHDENWIALHR